MDKKEMENEPDNKAHNRRGANAYQSYIASLIEGQETLKGSVNDVDMREQAKDVTPDKFTVSGEVDAPSDGDSGYPTENDKMSETANYAKEHEVPESALVKGTDSGKTPKHATDDMRDGHRGA